MGYELIIKYREKNEEGEYGEEIQEKKIKIGSPYDDVSLDICAGKIIAQLANRKKLVEDVEIYEYTKKKLTYKKIKRFGLKQLSLETTKIELL